VRISVRKFLVLMVCLVLVATIGTVLAIRLLDRGDRSTTAATPDPAGAWAYVTEDAVVVMRQDAVVVEVPRMSDLSDPQEYRTAWTHDGRYLVFLSDVVVRQKESEETGLVVVDAATGAVRNVPCPHCDDFTPVRERDILVRMETGSSTEHKMIRADDPSGATTPVTAAIACCGYLVSSPVQVITPEQVDGGIQLRLTSLDGTFDKVLGRFDSNTYLPAAVSAEHGSGATLFAVAFRTNPGLCGAFPIRLFRSDGFRGDTDMSAVEPDGIEQEDLGVEVHDLWTEPDGTFRATISATDCRSKDAEGAVVVKKSRTGVYRLWRATWVKEGDEPLTMQRRFDPAGTAGLAEHDCRGATPPKERSVRYCNTGTLSVARNGRRTVLRDDVTAISAPTAGGRPPGS